MSADPIFAATPKQGGGAVASADASYTGPTNVATLITAPASGTRVERARFVFTGTTSLAGFVNVFVHDGTNYRLIRSIPYTAITASVTVQPALTDGSGQITFEGGLILPSGYSLRASFTNGTGQLVGTCDAADF